MIKPRKKNATRKRKSCKLEKGIQKEYQGRDEGRETSEASGRDFVLRSPTGEEKEIALSPDDELLLLMRKINVFINQTERARRMVGRSQRNVLQKARGILSAMNRKEERLLKKIDSALKKHEGILKEILKVNQCVDEGMCNVLLAIRQNEYLQAWYPPQNGSKEQKVVGKYAV